MLVTDMVDRRGYRRTTSPSSSYVEGEDTRVAADIGELNAEIARIVARQAESRTKIDIIVADLEGTNG